MFASLNNLLVEFSDSNVEAFNILPVTAINVKVNGI